METETHLPRACLSGLQAQTYPSRQHECAAIKDQIARQCTQLKGCVEGGRKARKLTKEETLAEFKVRCEVAIVVLHVEDRGLLEDFGHLTPESMLADLWEGEGVGDAQLANYLRVARYLPDSLLSCGKANISLLRDLVPVAEAAEDSGLPAKQCKALAGGETMAIV